MGAGPIRTATGFQIKRRLSRAGEFSFTMDPREERAAYVVGHPERIVRCYGQRQPGGPLVELASGIVQRWETSLSPDGATLIVSGADMLRKLAWSTVDFLELRDGAGNGVDDALAQILAPAGWSFDPAGYASTGVYDYGSFAGETRLEALIKLAEHNGHNFRLAGTLIANWASPTIRYLRASHPDSGKRAVTGVDPAGLEANPALIVIAELGIMGDAWDLVTALHAYGAGNGDARLTLAHANRAIPAGFIFYPAQNLLINTAAEAAIDGVRIVRHRAWKEIAPVSNTSLDVQNAANVLFDAAVRELRLYGTPQQTYALRLSKPTDALLPGDTVRVVYSGWAPVMDGFGQRSGRYHWVDVDQDLIILEVVEEIGSGAVSLVVSTIDVWPVNDAELQAQQLEAGRLMEAHPQLSLSTYVTNYREELDSSSAAQLPIWLGAECTYVNHVLFRFQVTALRSTVKSVGGTSTSTGPSSASSSGGGGTSSPTSASPNQDHIHQTNIGNGGGTAVYYDGFGSLACAGGGYLASNAENRGHTHEVSIPSHAHNIEHTHDVSAAVSMEYGIFEETDPAKILAESDLAYSVNGGADLGGNVVDLGSGWYELDLTAALSNAYGRPAQDRNVLAISTASTGKACTVKGQLVVLTTVQAIAIT